MATAASSESVEETSFSTPPNIDKVLPHFRKSLVYKLEFLYEKGSRSSQNIHASVDNNFVVLLDSKEKKAALEKVKREFSVTNVEVDETNRVIRLKYTQSARGRPEAWEESVRRDFRKGSISLLTWAVVDVGEKAAEVKPLIENRFADNGLVCELSDDKTQLLFLSSNPSGLLLKKAENFARKANPVAALNSDFLTANDIRVSVFTSNITEVPADCVVSAVDEKLSFSGGVSADIAQVVGQEMRDECAGHTLKVTEVFVSKGGNRWKNVLHACGPRWVSPERQEKCGEQLTATILNCLKEANELKHKTIALPSVSSGTFQVPVANSAKSYHDAIEKFDQQFGRQATLRNIIFVDKTKGKVAELQSQMLESCTIKATDVLRVVLVGKTGVGKSSVSNSLIGQGQKGVFTVARSLKPVTHNSKMVPATIRGMNIEVVDTPGLFDQANEAEADKILKEILKSVALSLPGPHAFILVFNGDDRFNQAEKDVIKKMQELFRNQLLCHYLIVVFTRIESKDELDELLSNVPKDLTDLFTACKGRVLGIDNKSSDENREPQIKALLDAIKDMRKKNSARGQAFYKDELITRCLYLLQSEFADKSLEEIKKEIQMEDERISLCLTKDQQAAAAAKQTKSSFSGCTIL